MEVDLDLNQLALTSTFDLSFSFYLGPRRVNSANFLARSPTFSMEVDVDLTQLDLTSILTLVLALTSDLGG